MIDKAIIALIVVGYVIGSIGHLVPTNLPFMLRVTPVVLLIMGSIVFIPLLLAERKAAFWLWCAGVYLATFLLEAVGVAHGVIFGPYNYGATLGTTLWGVPLVSGLNWLLVILGSIGLITRWVRHPILSVPLVGVVAFAFDYVMEPVALALDYWQWQTPGIPIQNYVAWFLIASIVAVTHRVLHLETKSRVPQQYVLVQLAFFLILRTFLL
jgi:putative membrane protein